MSLPYSISPRLPLEEFHTVAEKHRQKIKIAHEELVSAFEIFYSDPDAYYEHSEYLLRAIFMVEETVQSFSSFLERTYNPYSVCELRPPLLNKLYFITQQTQEVTLQLFSFKDICHITTECTLLRQVAIRRKIEAILQESQNAFITIGYLLDQTRFLENRYRLANA